MVGQMTAALDPSALSTFRDAFAGAIIEPSDDRYDAARVVWNGMFDRRPALIVRPTGQADVITAVRFARERGLDIAVRGGGHSIPGFSTCDDGLIVDLSAMRGVRVDPDRRIAWANGGTLLSELDHEAQAFGLACPVGVVSHTGVAGLTLGGGMGRLMRRHGLTIDNLRSVDLVTADGRLVHASDDENPDLFWGMRGAGANFGVVTSFEFRLHPIGPEIVRGTVIHPVERTHELAALFREFVESSPDEVMTTFAIGPAIPAEDFPAEVAGRPIALISALHCGSLAAAERDFAGLRAFGTPVMDTFGPTTYLAAQHLNDGPELDWGHRFYMKSGYFGDLPDDLIDGCIGAVERAPGDCTFSFWAWGRAIAETAEDATAFNRRDAAFWGSAEVMWDDPAQDASYVGWAKDAMAMLQPFTMPGRYVNDVVEMGDDVVRLIYGDAKYERLRALKRAWDPDNVFHLNQNIRP